MSFIELLRKTREELQNNNVETIDNVSEVKTEENLDTITIDTISVASKIILESKAALKNKKLKSTNSCKRLAKNIAAGRITIEQLNKCFQIQRRFKPGHPNYHLVGGKSMNYLRTLLEQGLSLHDALKTQVER